MLFFIKFLCSFTAATEEERTAFIKAIKKLGYKQTSMKGIYPENKERLKSKPLMYTRGDERFDLFLKDIFGFKLTEEMAESFHSREDFIGKKEFILKVLSKEMIILLKAVTDREADFEDTSTIVEQDKNINWDFIIDQAVKQKRNKAWILIDLEETMKKLKKVTFIPSKYFDKVYKAEDL